MSNSDGSDEETAIPIAKKRRKSKVVESSESTEEANSDVGNKNREKKGKPKRRLKAANSPSDSDDDRTPKKKVLQTPAARSSDRLRKKKEFSLPSREERLEGISPGVMKTSTEKMRELRPRRLVNNFIRERNSYASEKYGDIYLTDDSMSDFIDDDEDDDDNDDHSSDDSDASSQEVQTEKKSARKRKKSKSDSNDDQLTKKSTKNKKKGKKVRRRKRTINSSSEENDSNASNDSDLPLSACVDRKEKRKDRVAISANTCNKQRSSRRKILESSESEQDHSSKQTNSNSDDNQKPNSETNMTEVRRSSRRKKLMEKESIRNQKYAKLKESRNKLNTKEKITVKKNEKIKGEENDSIDVLRSLIDNYSTDEDDKQFVISDKDVSEDEEIESDSELTFLKLRDSQSAAEDGETVESSPSKASIKMRRKRQNQASKWKRINTKIESDKSEDSGSDNDEYDHGCALHDAVKKNNLDSAKEILQKDPKSVHELGYRNRSALHLAALNGNAKMVQLLVKGKANCRLQDKYGFPAIAYAANGHAECLKVLLKNADIKKANKTIIQTNSKMSLLHLAVGESRMAENCDERGRCMEILFAHDRDACVNMMDHRDARDRAPLEAAVFASQHKCVEVLLKQGANPLAYRTGEDGNLLHFAVECASHLKGASTDVADSSLCLKELVEPLKLCINAKDTHGFTPLMYACESGNHECLLTLIEAGAKVFTTDDFGTSPLHLAAMAGSTECVQLLLTYNHPVECVDKSGWPPLLYADFNAKEECVLALMKPKPEQLFVLGNLLKRQKTAEDKKKTFKVVKNVLMSLANHDAYYTVFNDFIRINPELLDQYNHGLLQQTWRAILDFNNKQRWFKRRLNDLPSGSLYWGGGCSLSVDRDDVLGSAMRQIGQVSGARLRGSMQVSFNNEAGMCTGPKREFFVCLCKDVINPDRGLFEETDDSQYSPVPNAYFSTFPIDVSNSAAPPPTETKSEEIKNDIKEDLLEDILMEDFTDSELLTLDFDNVVGGNAGDAVTNNGVTGDGITNNSVTGDGFTNNDVTGDGVTNNDVTGDGVTDTCGSVTDDRVTNNIVADDGMITSGNITGGVTNSTMTVNCVTNSNMADGDMTSTSMTVGGVTNSNTARDVSSSDVTPEHQVTSGRNVSDINVPVNSGLATDSGISTNMSTSQVVLSQSSSTSTESAFAVDLFMTPESGSDFVQPRLSTTTSSTTASLTDSVASESAVTANPLTQLDGEPSGIIMSNTSPSQVVCTDSSTTSTSATTLSDRSVPVDSECSTITHTMAQHNSETSSLITSNTSASLVSSAQSSTTFTSATTLSNTTAGDGFISTNSQETLSDSRNQTTTKEETKWISCVGKKSVVIPSIALRMKMKQLRFIGKLVGSAICQDMLLNFHLSKPFVKQVLGIPLSHPDDLASFDNHLYENMAVWMKENSVDDLDLPFSLDAINPWTGGLVTVNLDDDDDKMLNDANKDEYAELVSLFKLETFIKKEMEEFKAGLNEVIPSDLLTFFTADEFSLLLNGVTKIDVEDWKQNTVYVGIVESAQIITWFWDIVSKLKEEEKALLLQFSTGSPCVPIGGFANLKGLGGENKFTISYWVNQMNKIPSASTCFNRLQLTNYDSEKELREKLLIAIRHGSQGFSFG